MNVQFTQEELALLSDQSFLRTKAKVLAKMQLLMAETRELLRTQLPLNQFPQALQLSPGKISKGENYRQLPYLVLDYPATFQQQDICAFRTMFWWGHFFSCTVVLQGWYRHQLTDHLLAHLDTLVDAGLWICTAPTPWEHPFTPDNFEKLAPWHGAFLMQHPFLKFGDHLPLDEWPQLPAAALRFASLFAPMIAAVTPARG